MENITLFDEEKALILSLIKRNVEKGGTIREMVDCLRLYEKIDGKKIP